LTNKGTLSSLDNKMPGLSFTKHKQGQQSCYQRQEPSNYSNS